MTVGAELPEGNTKSPADEMKDEYDFTNAKRGLWFLPKGKKLEIRLASTERIDARAHEARELFARVLEFDFDECLVTDESRIGDFAPESTLEELHSRIVAEYRVDLSDLGNTYIVDVLDEIARRRPTR